MRPLWLVPLVLALAPPVLAQDTPATAPRIELNRADPVEGACRLIFVAENPGAETIAALSIEAVLFDRDGRVALLTLLDLGELPAGRMRVRSFDLAGQDCGGLSRLLINAAQCQPAAACADGPVWSSVTGIEVRS